MTNATDDKQRKL